MESVFGLPLANAVLPGAAIPLLVDNVLSVLSFVLPPPEDLFTLPITEPAVTSLRAKWDAWAAKSAGGAPVDPNETPITPETNPRVLASLLMMYLKALPHPLIPPKFYWTFEKVAEVGMGGGEVPALAMLRIMVHMLPPTCTCMVTRIVEFLCATGFPPAQLANTFSDLFLRPTLELIPNSPVSPSCIWVMRTMIQNASYVCSSKDQPMVSPEINSCPFKLEAMAMFDFEGESNADCLQLRKDDQVYLLNLYPGDWVEGFSKDDPSKVGFMPLGFVEIVPLPEPATLQTAASISSPTGAPPVSSVPSCEGVTTEVTYDIPPESTLEEAPEPVPEPEITPTVGTIFCTETAPVDAVMPSATDETQSGEIAALMVLISEEAPSPFDYESNTSLPEWATEAPSPSDRSTQPEEGVFSAEDNDYLNMLEYTRSELGPLASSYIAPPGAGAAQPSQTAKPQPAAQPVAPPASQVQAQPQAQVQPQPQASIQPQQTQAQPQAATTPVSSTVTPGPTPTPSTSPTPTSAPQSTATPANPTPDLKQNRRSAKVPMKPEERQAMLTQASGANSYKVVVIGGGGVGKSAVTISFVQNHFIAEYDPTIEDSYRKQVTVDDLPVVLSIMDTAGQEEYSAMRDQYMRYGDGFLIVFSLTARNSFTEVQRLHQHLLEVKDEVFPTVIVGNKADLVNSYQVTLAEGQQLGEKLGVPYMTVSAKTHTNIIDTFNTLVRLMRKHTPASKTKKQRRGPCCIL
ncbi:ras family small GTPase [Pelomyxa schiedti]|nr:ras family small GTPase [Pelomyxa schiedti]